MRVIGCDVTAVSRFGVLLFSGVVGVCSDYLDSMVVSRESQEDLGQGVPAVSVLARLQNAAQEVRECPAAEKPVRDFGAR